MPISDILRQAVLDSGLSLRELGRRAQVDASVMVRFANGQRSLTLPSADRLAVVLGLRLVPTAEDRPGGGQPLKKRS